MAVKDTLTPKRLKRLLATHNLIDIAKKYGVSKQYISQLYAEYKERFPELFDEKEITARWLSKKLETHTIKEICEKTGKSYHHIKKLMAEYGIERPTASANFDRDYIHEQYVVQCKSDEEIAKHYGCSASLVKKFRQKHSILYTDRQPLSERLTKELATSLIVEGQTIEQLVERFDATPWKIRRVIMQYDLLSDIIDRDFANSAHK